MTREHMQWIDAALEGSITEEDFEALQQVMRRDPVVLRHYQEQAMLHGELEWELREAPAPATTEPAADRPTRHALRWLPAAAAAVVLGGLAVFFALRPGAPAPLTADAAPTDSTVAEPLPPSSVARIASLKQAQWTLAALRRGDRLLPGRYNLESGSATLVFDSGATLALKGPSDLEIVSATRILLHAGRATVEIPDQASGFLLETPTAALSDPNTRFSVSVDAQGHTELHVIDGVLELAPKFGDLDPILVRADRPVTVDPKEILEAANRPFEDFPELPDATGRLAPGFVHWDFDVAVTQGRDRTTFADRGLKRGDGRNFPAQAQTRNVDSAVALVEGRFGNAIKLNGQGSFLSTDLPGVPGHRARTVAFWVQIPPNATTEQSYSIISWGRQTPGNKWQIGWNVGRDNEGTPGAIRTEVGSGFCIGSTDLRDGRWHHVASVFLGGEGALPATHILHYVDGRLEATTAAKNVPIHTRPNGKGALPVAVGRRLEPDMLKYTFKGLIDELYLFPEALSPRQIERLHLENSTDPGP